MTSRPRPAAAMAETSDPTAQIPMDATRPRDAPRVERREEEREGGQGDDLGRPRKASVASALPSQIALRSDGARTRPSSARPRARAPRPAPSPSSAVKTSATHSRPYAASSPGRPAAKWKTTSVDEHEEQHRGQGVPRAQLEPQVLPGERGHSARYCSCGQRQPPVASGSSRPGSCVATTSTRLPRAPRALRRERCAAGSSAEWARRGRAAPARGGARGRARAAASSRATRPDTFAACSQSPNRSRSSRALAPLRDAIEPPEELEVLEAVRSRVEDRLVADVADRASGRPPRRASRVWARRDRRARGAASSCPDPFGPVTTGTAPRLEGEWMPRSTVRTRSASRARPTRIIAGSAHHAGRLRRRPSRGAARQPPPGAPPVP